MRIQLTLEPNRLEESFQPVLCATDYRYARQKGIAMQGDCVCIIRTLNDYGDYEYRVASLSGEQIDAFGKLSTPWAKESIAVVKTLRGSTTRRRWCFGQRSRLTTKSCPRISCFKRSSI
ncbi:MAG: hypothetical protein HC888_04020 [Candidatus Competibacteraceae bacterium]|nr:hypothetical protein [Candidatus Competibacteraceae bacterium]